MNNPHTLALTALALSVVSIVVCGVSLALYFKAHRRARDLDAVVLRLEGELGAMSGDLDSAAARTNDYGRRVAWLETRIRTSAGATVQPEPEPLYVEDQPSRPNITERRHRVLKLHARGQDPRTIAATLGMPHGEVELIIGLTAAA